MARKSLNEKRESRISLLVTQNFYERINLLASSQGATVNDFIVKQLDRVINKNSAVIEQFKKARQDAQAQFSDAD